MARQMYEVQRRWNKPPPAPMTNEWEAVWVNFNDYDKAWVCAIETALEDDGFRAYEYRIVEQERMYAAA
jgi:hypothetical protein